MAALAVALTLGAAALVPAPARAQNDDNNFNHQNWKPALDAYGYATVEGARSLSMLQFHLQTYYNWSERPLRLPLDQGGQTVIDELFMMNAALSVGVLPGSLLGEGCGLSIGLDLPIALYEDGNEVGSQRDLTVSGWGDLRASVKLTLFNRDDDLLGLALQATLEFPTGDEDMFLSPGPDHATPAFVAIIEKRLFIFRIGVNVGYEVQAVQQSIPGIRIDDKIKLSGALALEPFEPLDVPLLKGLGVFTEVIHWTLAEDPWNDEFDSPTELGVGARYTGALLDILAGMSFGLNDGPGAPDTRFYLSLSFLF